MEPYAWIQKQCECMNAVVDFGCGFGTYLAGLSPGQRVGVDIYQPYLDRDESQGATLIRGDMRDMSILPELAQPAVAIIFDALEHIYKEDAINFLQALKSKFKRIAIQTPFGFHEQNTDYYEMGGDTFQTHRSGWFPEELEALGFSVEVVTDYHASQAHKGSTNAIFAVYDE